jgi:flagellar basal-body rod modification protein FlgD
MNTHPASALLARAQAAANNNTTSDSAQQANDLFLQLLVAQLKGQSPLDPLDPNQFVGQLVQFNSLDQLIQIRQLLQNVTQPA